MPLRPSGRLPQRFRRGFTRATHTVVKRRYERRKKFRQERMRRTIRRAHQLILQWRRSLMRWMVVTIVAVVLLLIGLILFSPILELHEIKVYRASPRLNIEEVQHVLSPLFHRHLFFLTAGEVDELLREKIADIEHVEVQKIYPSQLRVRIALDPLVAQLEIVDPEPEAGAPREPETGSGSGLDFVSNSGIYIRTPTTEDPNQFPLVRIVDWAVRPMPGTQLVPADILSLLWATESALREQFGHEIEARTLYLRAQEFHIRADGLDFWFDHRSTLEAQLQRYRLFLQSVPRDSIRQYIDLRLRDRVVYR